MSFDPRTVTTHAETRLGPVTLAATGQGLAGLWFAGQKHHPDTRGWRTEDDNPWLALARTQLAEYLAGRRTGFDLPLDLRSGSVFQQAVWHALCTIPAGTTTSYGAISRQIGRPSAVRAVGAAVGRNPVSIIVPCHRVLGANGALTGYAGGLERKAALLALESAATASPTGVCAAERRSAETVTIAA